MSQRLPGESHMTEPISREIVDTFYRAYAARDIAAIEPFLDENVEWTISGPIDVLPFCGVRHGRAAVLDLIARRVPHVFRVYSFVTEMMLVDGNRASSLNRLSAWRTSDGRVISYRVAHFMRFRDGKVVENLSLIDSFDAAEQVLGRSLSGQRAPIDGDLVAV